MDFRLKVMLHPSCHDEIMMEGEMRWKAHGNTIRPRVGINSVGAFRRDAESGSCTLTLRVGLSESDLAHGESITVGFTQQPRQGRRQLSIDNEFHGTLRTAWSA